MNQHVKKLSLIWLCIGVFVGASAAEPEGESSIKVNARPEVGERKSTLEVVSTAQDLILLERAERSLPPVEATADESLIARLVARLLPRSHYSRQPFDDAMSSRFLDRYIENLDNLRLHFLQSDLEEFEEYRSRLDDLTAGGDTEPARRIFDRFLSRVGQRVAYVAELLKDEKFKFDGDDRYRLDREGIPFPKDLEEAKALWRQHLRFEILQEILAKAESSTDKGVDPAEDQASESTEETEEVERPNGLSAEVEKTISRRYARLLKTLKDFDGGDVFQYYLGALSQVYDPHSDYLGRATLENFAITMNLSLFGIGAVLTSEDGYCKVRELRPGPAMRSKKIKEGDRIVAVAQGDDGEPIDVVDWKLSKIVEMIRGPKGAKVRLTIIPADAADPSERREVALIRDEIKLEDEEAKASIIDLPTPDGPTRRIGVIDLPSFYQNLDIGTPNGRSRAKSTTMDVAHLLDKLKRERVEGVILDLRRNGGGSLKEAIDLTGLFIEAGPVVQVRDSRGHVMVDEDPSADVFYDGPLAVLTSRFSASASEILAGCLQDYGRAVLVGDSATHGKGTVQSLIELQPMLAHMIDERGSNPGAVKVTIRKFYRASGASTQLKGIVPDIVLPSVNNVAEVGESALDDPLPWDTISAAQFEPEKRIAGILDELRARSDRRVAIDQDFQYIQEDMELYLERKEDKSVSLNLSRRLEEKARNEARMDQRKEEREARSKPRETVYEITLKDVELPGLPPPLDAEKEEEEQGPGAGVGQAAEERDDGSNHGPVVDATLEETKRILLDLIDLRSSEGSGLASHN
jgi:carboxyl-terminal processing protease